MTHDMEMGKTSNLKDRENLTSCQTMMDEKELEACFYVTYRKWEKMFREHMADKTDRKLTIMEPVFFSWDKDIEDVPETLEEPESTHSPVYDTSHTTKKGENDE